MPIALWLAPMAMSMRVGVGDTWAHTPGGTTPSAMAYQSLVTTPPPCHLAIPWTCCAIVSSSVQSMEGDWLPTSPSMDIDKWWTTAPVRGMPSMQRSEDGSNSGYERQPEQICRFVCIRSPLVLTLQSQQLLFLGSQHHQQHILHKHSTDILYGEANDRSISFIGLTSKG